MDTLIQSLLDKIMADVRAAIQTVLEDAVKRGRNGGLRDDDVTRAVIHETLGAVEQVEQLYARRYGEAELAEAEVSPTLAKARRDMEYVVAQLRKLLESHVHEPSSRDALLRRFDKSADGAVMLELDDLRAPLNAQVLKTKDKKAAVKRNYLLKALGVGVAILIALWKCQ